MRKVFLLVVSVFYTLNSNAQAVGGWGTCEFATVVTMNAFDPSSDDNHCKKAYVKATNEHYRWDGSQWVQEDSQNIYNSNGTLDANRMVNLSGSSLTFNGTTDIIFEADGDVGIGTLAPAAKLDITGVSLLRNGAGWRGGGNGQLQFGHNGTTNYRHAIKSRHDNSDRYNSLDFYIWQHGIDTIAGLGTLEVMTVSGRNSGSVGIGTQSPVAKLEVSGGKVRFSDYGTGTHDDASPARLLGVKSDGDIIEFELSSSDLSDNIYNTNGTLDSERTVTMGSNDLILNGSGDYRFRSSGNFGIGTATPEAKLDVTGISLLRNGSDWRPTGDGQIQFGRAGTSDYRHVIKSRHDNSNRYNSLDFYVWQHGVDAIDALGTLEVMTISSRNSGSVGIGVQNPDAKFQVNGGDVRFSDYGVGAYDVVSPARLLGVNATGNVVEFSLSSSDLSDNFYNTNGTLTSNRTVTMGSNDLTLNGSGDVTFNSSGNVGIGTVSGGAKLDVNGVSLLRNGSDWRPTGDGQIQFGRAGTGQHRHVIKSKHHGTNNAYNSLDFYLWHVADTNAVDLGTLNVMTVSARNSGSIGIGTLAPAAKLEVNGGNVRFSDYGTGTHDEASPARLLGVKSDGDIVEYELSSSDFNDNIYNINGTLDSDRTVTMGSNDLTLNGSGDFRFRSSGNLGIGTAVPSAKLDVDGVSLLRNGSDWRPTGDGQIQFGRAGTGQRRHVIKSKHHGTNDAYNSLDFYLWHVADSDADDLGTLNVMTVSGRNSGSVGIGTLAPAAKLEVSGGGVIFSDYGTGTHNDASPAKLLGVKNTGEVVEMNLSASTLQDNIYNINGTLDADRTVTMGSNDLIYNGSGDYRFRSSGNFGIGTLAPTEKLDVTGTMLLRNGSDWRAEGNGQIQFSRSGTADRRHVIKSRHQPGNNYNGLDFYIWEDGTDGVSDLGSRHAMSVTGRNSGSVGIGTINPVAKLEVSGGKVRFSDYGTGAHDDASPARILGVQADGDIVEIAPADLFTGNTSEQRKNTWNENIQTTDQWLSNDGEDEGVYIAPNGNVGVGTKNTDALLSVGKGEVAFEDYGKGNNAKGEDTYMISVDASGNLQEMNTAKNARVFYPPAVPIDVSAAGEGTVNLYNQYQELFTKPMISSPDAAGIPIPSYRANELHYYITDYDTSVFSNVAISNAGVLTYTVAKVGGGNFSSMNVVFVVK